MAGAAMYDNLGYRGTFDVVQFMMYGIGLFYLVFVAGFHAFDDYNKQLEEQQHLTDLSEQVQKLRNG